MGNINEKALKNAVASAEMEGYRLNEKELKTVKDSIKKNLSTKDFLNIILANLKKV